MRRMQEGVEQLETLDVSGNSQPETEAVPEDQTAAVPAEPLEPEPEFAEPDVTAQPEPPSPAACPAASIGRGHAVGDRIAAARRAARHDAGCRGDPSAGPNRAAVE